LKGRAIQAKQAIYTALFWGLRAPKLAAVWLVSASV